MVGLFLLSGSVAWAADYVFYYNNYFVGSNNTAGQTSFVPNASIYTQDGTSFRNANGYYLRGRNGGDLRFSTTLYDNWAINGNVMTYNSYYDLVYYNNKWQVQYNYNNYRATAAQVTTTPVIASLSNFSITSGNSIIGTTGAYNYSHSNTSYTSAYTKYSWTGHTYYSTDASQAASTTAPNATEVTTGYTWSLTGGGSYASVNSSTGAITVGSLPTIDTEMTLTCSVTSNGVTKTASKTVVLQGTTIAAPTITNSNNNISLSTASVGATIYYTTDGTEPSASNGSTYNGTFSIENLSYPVTVKAIAIRNGASSTITTETFSQPKCATPVISISTTGAVTITSLTEGATIRYTTNGTDPTSTSGTVYNGTFNVSNLATVKAIAYKDGYTASEVAEKQYITSGTTSGGQVILNDYEDHKWSYYSDPDCPIRSLSPADVKITYYGDGIVMTGNNDYTASSSDFVRTGNSNYVGGAKVNVGGENENTFVYYKTLERGDATQTAWTYSSGNQSSAASRCPYTPIPNPFQVRPTYGSTWDGTNTDTWTGWRGFQCWRLKSVTNGAVYSAASGGTALSNGAVINAETEIFFAPNAEYGMEVELEAVWAIAYVVKANNGEANAIQQRNVGYERNFIVLHSTNSSFNFGGTSGKRITNINYSATVSTYYPDGSQGTNSGSTIRGAATAYNLTLQADTKFENMPFNMGSNTLSAANHSLIIGRGCSGTINYVSGVNANVTSPSYTIRIESGTINYLSYIRGYSTTGGTATDVPGNYQTYTVGGTPNVKGVLGCDYDRATNSGITDNLIINNGAYYAYSVSEANGIEYSDNALNVHVKSGKIGNSFTINNSYTADASQAFYIGVAGARVRGHRQLFMEGGEVASIAGGIDATQNQYNNSVSFRMTGGHVRGAVYGGAARSAAYGNRNLIVTGGNITGWIGGGCNGEAYPAGQNDEDVYGGITNGAARVYFGGNATCGGTGSNVNINGSQGGIVFGAGKGVEGNTTSGRMSQGTTVVVADACDIERNVYGGGNFGYAQTSTDVYVSGGTVHGSVFGGSNQNNGPVVNVTMKGGTIENDLYGGSNQSGNITGAVNVKVYGGTVKGAVYGCNNAGGAPQSTVNVDIYGTDPAPYENAYALGAVFGGGNQANYNGTPVVTVHNCDNSIEYVYGGGNAAAVAATNVTIWGGNKIGNVFGGGNGTVTAANVNGNAVTKIYGGTIGKVFGGSNSQGTISGSISVTVQKQAGDSDPDGSTTACDMHIDEVYGGGNMAASQAGSITIGCTGGQGEGIGDVYGGANQANIGTAQNPSNIALNITGGSINRVFGGNNVSGTINGTITVNVNWDTTNPCGYNYLGSVFGAGNLATYTGSPTVNILNGTVSENVYGGGKGNLVDGADRGKAGKVTGNPAVTIGDSDANHTAIVLGDVYGGGDAADVAGTPVIVVNDCNTEIGYLYGGGNAADVNGTNITVNGGTIHHDAFGGGHGDKNASNPSKYADVKGNVVFNVYGGTFGRVFAGSNSKGDITGTSALTINKTGTCAMKIREVYGGGNEAAGNAGTVTIGCTGNIVTGDAGHAAHPENIGTTLEGIGTVYGGANAADIGKNGSPSNITLNINSGMVNNVFGGNNTSGDIYGTITVNINKNAETCGWYVGSVFGGGNQAVYTAPTGSTNYPVVNILNGTVSGDVFGGGYGHATDKTKGVVNGNPQVTINGANASVLGGVYGGGSLAPTVGNPVVTLTNGSTVKVFGGGKAAGITGAPTVNINGGSVTTGVYGGCDSSGNVTGNIVVNINGGTLGTSSARLTSGIFGGGFGAATTTAGNVTVNVGDENAASAAATSTIYGDIYGGSALGTVNDAVADLTTVNINNGTIHGNIYGGGLGAAVLDLNGYIDEVTTEAVVNGTVHVNIGTSTQASNFVTIDGQVFGCNNLAGSPKGPVYVDVYHTAHTATNAYPSTEPATAADVTQQASSAFAIGAVYGGGNLAHYTTTVTGASTHVTIHGCDNTIEYVYGGGNAANSPATDVVIEGGRFNYIFGGGNGAGTGNPGANIVGNAKATITGGLVYRAFGGSNTKGTIGGTSQVVLPDNNITCDPRLVHEIFGGGNEAPGGNVDMVIPCGTTGTGIIYAGANNADMGTEIDFNNGRPVLIKLTVEGGNFTQVFGGNNQGGTIWGNVELHLKGGTIVDAFGGNNFGGEIKGTIKVFVDEDSSCPLVLTNVYGGGYNAAYTPADTSIISPIVYVNHLKSGNKILGSVYGGGYGAPATVTANPKVIVGDVETGHESKIATIAGNVYGGGNAAKVVNSTTVLIQKANTVIDGRVFGAGKGSDSDPTVASVDKNTTVTMTGGWVKTNIYGGGEMASVGTYTRDAQHVITAVTANTGTTKVNISGGTVGPNGLNPTNIDGNGNVFGGGLGKAGDTYSNSAYVNMSYVNVTNGTVRGSVFGGGENGHIKGDTHVTIGGGEVGVRVPYEYRNIHTDFGSSNPLFAGNVYGGGRGVDHTAVGDHLSETAGRVYGNTNVSVTGGLIRHAVYGGGSLASVGTYTLTADNSVFGGHLHNFTAGTGNATVEISGGRIGPSWDDLYWDKNGRHLVDASGIPVDNVAKDSIARYFECLGENEGMVYGSGRGMNYPNDNNTDHELYVEMAFTNNTFVTIKGDNTEVVGSVFGGGENGHVKGNTQVNIQGGTIGGFRLHHKGFYLPGHMNETAYFIPDDEDADDELNTDVNGTGKVIFRGNVYGGGRGVDHITALDPTQAQQIYSISAGRVYGNTVVNITGGHVLHNVFGGGSIASVGTYSYPVSGGDPQFLNENPESCWANTGKATVNVTGGMVGQMGENEGYIYGGCRGVAGGRNAQVTHLAYVNETEVKIGTGTGTHADVRGSVFGGGMNGHVLTDTHVTMTGGVVGGKTDEDFGTYDTENFPIGDKPTQADYTIDGVSYYSGIPKDAMELSDAGIGASNVFLGNVYGGGRGVDHFGANNDDLSLTAGRVYGNTFLTVSGGVVYHSLFGGGSIASVGTYTTYTDAEVATDAAATENYSISAGQPKACNDGTGTATVTVTGGRIGTDGHNNGRVFGSSRGMAGVNYRGLGYVNTALVTIGTSGTSTGPEIRGSVFGSGENGHVLTSTQVNIESGHIGNGKATTASDHYVGNVYGGGRGLDRDHHDGTTVSPFAGRVYGTTTVNVRGGQIDHNVYGGGSLASVGRFKRLMDDSNQDLYRTITYADPGVGICNVNVSGGTIGIDGDGNGHVFGSSRGTAAGNRDILSSLAYVADTRVTISGGAVKGSVFGGGESGHVQRDAKVTVSGGTIGSAIPKDYAACTAAEKEMYDLMGNVYGAGRGVDTYNAGSTGDQYSFSAGYVRGNTEVEITGGTIHRNVYGGGSMGIVGDYGPHALNDFFEGDPATNGLAKVTIKGAVGTAADVAHGYGGNVFGSSRGKANDPSDPTHDFAEMSYSFQTQVNVDTGADVFGNVYGGGENGHVDYAGTTVTVKNGRVRGSVFGGGKGNISSATAGIIDGPTRVYIGTSDQQTNTVVIDGDVFAGNDTHSSPLGEMRVDVYCIKSDATLRAVYGGGNLANVLTGVAANDVTPGYSVFNTDYITQRIEQTDPDMPASFKPWPGGTSRKSIVYVHTGNHAIGSVFGGGKMANCKLTEVTIDGGVTTDVYGGGEQGAVTETTRVDLVSGTVTNVYGGGLGKKNGFFGSTEDVAADVGGNVIVNLNGGSSVTSPSNNCVVKGSIFGCNNLNGTPKGHVTVHVYKTQGWTDTKGTADTSDDVSHTRSASKDDTTYEVAAVYGGGNMAAYVPTSGTETTDVIIDGCDLTSIEYVYGGGNAASVPNAKVTVNGTYEIGTVFGGGNGKDQLPNGANNPGAHVGFLADGTTTYANGAAGTVDVYLFGGTIHNAFGGSNTLGNIRGKSQQHIDEAKDGTGAAICPLLLDEAYGGGNVAYMAGGTDIDLGCVTYLKAIYGGARNADVGGDINLTITSGHFDRVFGGNNLGGKISGAITVNIEETGCNPITIGELYGCGNQAAYSVYGYKNTGTAESPVWVPRTSLTDGTGPATAQTNPTVNVKSFTSIGRIFGGGLGAPAIVAGSPTVNINEVVGDHATVMTWPYHQTTKEENGQTVPDAGKTITFSDGNSVVMPTHESGKIGAIGTVFGGGNAAQVTGNTNVNVGTEAIIKYTSDAASDPDRNVVGVDIRGNVFGGGNKADVTGNTNVVIGR